MSSTVGPEQLARIAQVAQRALRLVDLGHLDRGIGHLAERRPVAHGVVAEGVPGAVRLRRQRQPVGRGQLLPDQEEGRSNPPVVQGGQYLIAHSRGRTVVEGQGDASHGAEPSPGSDDLSPCSTIILSSDNTSCSAPSTRGRSVGVVGGRTMHLSFRNPELWVHACRCNNHRGRADRRAGRTVGRANGPAGRPGGRAGGRSRRRRGGGSGRLEAAGVLGVGQLLCPYGRAERDRDVAHEAGRAWRRASAVRRAAPR